MPIILIFSLSTDFAGFLFQDGDYYRAITEYKRVLNYGVDVDTGYVMEMIATAYALSNKYRPALPYIASAYQYNGSEKIMKEYGWLLLKNKKWDDVLFLTEGENDRLSKIYKGIALIQAGNLKKGQIILAKTLPAKLLPDNGNIYKFLSYIIPGSGQILAGKIRSGIVSMVINFGLGYLTYDSVSKGNYYNAVILGFNLSKFYHGNIDMINHIIKKKNEKKIKKIIKTYKPF